MGCIAALGSLEERRISYPCWEKSPDRRAQQSLYCSPITFPIIQGDQKVSVHLTITVQNTQIYSILSSFNHLRVCGQNYF